MLHAPPEVICLVLSFLNINELPAASSVCKTWRSALTSFDLCFDTHSLSQYSRPSPHFYEQLAQLLATDQSQEDEDSNAVLFNDNRNDDVVGSIKAATIPRLLDVMADPTNAEWQMTTDELRTMAETFFSTYRSFISTRQLFDLIFGKFVRQLDAADNTRALIGYFRLVKYWIEYSLHDTLRLIQSNRPLAIHPAHAAYFAAHLMQGKTEEEMQQITEAMKSAYANSQYVFDEYETDELLTYLYAFIDAYLIRNSLSIFALQVRGVHLKYDWELKMRRNLQDSVNRTFDVKEMTDEEVHSLYNIKAQLEQQELEYRTEATENTQPPSALAALEQALFSQFSVDEIARQLTIREFEMFEQLASYELCDLGWRTVQHSRALPARLRPENANKLINHFQSIASFVTHVIVALETAELRAERISYFISLAMKLLELRNFQTMFAVIAGLTSAPVHRLKRSFQLVEQEYLNSLEMLREVVSIRGNMQTYRGYVSSCDDMPCIPYMGVGLIDIKAIHDTLQSGAVRQLQLSLREKHIQLLYWTVRMREYRAIQHLLHWQQLKTWHTSSGDDSQWCKNMFIQQLIDICLQQSVDDADALYTLSLLREPRGV